MVNEKTWEHIKSVALQYEWREMERFLVEYEWDDDWMSEYFTDFEAEMNNPECWRPIYEILLSAFEDAHGKHLRPRESLRLINNVIH